MNANICRCHEDYTKNQTCLQAEDSDSEEPKGLEEVSDELLISLPKQVSGIFDLTDSTSSGETLQTLESTGRVSSSSNIVFYQSESCRYIMLPDASIPDHILALAHGSSSSLQGLVISRRCLRPLRFTSNDSSDTSNLVSPVHVTNAIIPNSRAVPRVQERPLLHLARPNNLQIRVRMRLMRHMIMESVLYTRRPSLVEFNSLTSQYGARDVQVSGQSRISYAPETEYQYMNHIWLDVDNMSYEELLALEDHIGYVSTGLSEDAIFTSLRHGKYFVFAEENSHRESCSICQESYVEGDDLGTLDCCHVFHIACINRWLACKNSCPICKCTGLDTSGPSLHQIDDCV